MIYGITGPTDITEAQYEYVGDTVAKYLQDGDYLVSGCAYGVDSAGIDLAIAKIEDGIFIQLVLTIPYGEKYHDLMVECCRDAHLVGNVAFMYVLDGYMARNDKTIELSDELLAFPKTRKEELRSGTWATIRRAKKKGIPVHLFPLDEL